MDNENNTRDILPELTNNEIPDEESGISIEAHVRVFDPETNESFVSLRS